MRLNSKRRALKTNKKKNNAHKADRKASCTNKYTVEEVTTHKDTIEQKKKMLESLPANAILDFFDLHSKRLVEPWYVYAQKLQRVRMLSPDCQTHREFIAREHEKMYGKDSQAYFGMRRHAHIGIESSGSGHRHRKKSTIMDDKHLSAIKCIRCLEQCVFENIQDEMTERMRWMFLKLRHFMYCDKPIIKKRQQRFVLQWIERMEERLLPAISMMGCPFHANNLASMVSNFDAAMSKKSGLPQYNHAMTAISACDSNHDVSVDLNDNKPQEHLFTNKALSVLGMLPYSTVQDTSMPVPDCVLNCPFIGPLRYMTDRYGVPNEAELTNWKYNWQCIDGKRVFECGCEVMSGNTNEYVCSNKTDEDFAVLKHEIAMLRNELAGLRSKW